MADLAELSHAQAFGLDKRLVDVDGQPGMAFDQRAANANYMHNREDLRLLEIGAFRSAVVGEHASDVWCTARETGRRPRADHRVEFARFEHAGKRAIVCDWRVIDIRGQTQWRTLSPSRFLDAALTPAHRRGFDAVFILKNAADPDIGGDLVFRHTDRLARKIGRRRDTTVRANVDARVTEQARDESRNCHIGAIA